MTSVPLLTLVPTTSIAAIYEKAQARANRPLSQRGYATLARVIKKMDKGNHHFVTGVKPTRKEKRMAKYATQEA
jgi:hypothetical protein